MHLSLHLTAKWKDPTDAVNPLPMGIAERWSMAVQEYRLREVLEGCIVLRISNAARVSGDVEALYHFQDVGLGSLGSFFSVL